MKKYIVSASFIVNKSDDTHKYLKSMVGPHHADEYKIIRDNEVIDSGNVNQFESLSHLYNEFTGNDAKQDQLVLYNKLKSGKINKIAGSQYYEDKDCQIFSNGYNSGPDLSEWSPYILDHSLLNDENLRTMEIDFYVNDVKNTKSYRVLEKKRKELGIPSGTRGEIGFNIHWAFVIPPKGDDLLLNDPFEDHDILLGAPVYKTEKLDNGGIFVQLTEKYDVFGENKEYIDTWIAAFNYFKNSKSS